MGGTFIYKAYWEGDEKKVESLRCKCGSLEFKRWKAPYPFPDMTDTCVHCGNKYDVEPGNIHVQREEKQV